MRAGSLNGKPCGKPCGKLQALPACERIRKRGNWLTWSVSFNILEDCNYNCEEQIMMPPASSERKENKNPTPPPPPLREDGSGALDFPCLWAEERQEVIPFPPAANLFSCSLLLLRLSSFLLLLPVWHRSALLRAITLQPDNMEMIAVSRDQVKWNSSWKTLCVCVCVHVRSLLCFVVLTVYDICLPRVLCLRVNHPGTRG